MLVSHAQNFEDVILWRCLKSIENGVYIDIGANDPIVDSVTLAFYEHGWRGTHVEPVSECARRLRDERPGDDVVEALVGHPSRAVPFYEVSSHGLSTAISNIAEAHAIGGMTFASRSVPSIPLSSILAPYEGRDVHFMKIDVEGMEEEVIASWRPSPARPWILVIESTLPNSQVESYAGWEPEVLGLGYEFVYFDGLNRFYLHRAHADLKRHFGPGPNVFDGFTLAPARNFFIPSAVRNTRFAARWLEAALCIVAAADKPSTPAEDGAGQSKAPGGETINHASKNELVEIALRAASGDNEKAVAKGLAVYDRLRKLDIALAESNKQRDEFRTRVLEWTHRLGKQVEHARRLPAAPAGGPVVEGGAGWLKNFLKPRQVKSSVPGGLFDPDFYLRQNPDVARAQKPPLEHFISMGWREGRDPHPFFAIHHYFQRHPDVVASGVDPLTHYRSIGWRRGYSPYPLFDNDWYLAQNPGLAGDETPLEHYLRQGAVDGLSPHPLFDARWYRETNRLAEGTNPLEHYFSIGAREGLDPHPLFDTRFYVSSYGDVANAGVNPLFHYVEFGARELRNPHPLFDARFYLALAPEARDNPLAHYVSRGRALGLDPHPDLAK